MSDTPDLTIQTLLPPGTILQGRYRIIDDVAEGQLDHLYIAQDVQEHQRVMLRVMRPDLATNPEQVQSFEAQASRIRTTDPTCPLRLLEFGQDAHHGPFAAIANPERRPGDVVLPLLEGYLAAPEPERAESDWDFPFESRDISLTSLPPPAEPAAEPEEAPGWAVPSRPKPVSNLELDHSVNRGGPVPKITPITSGPLPPDDNPERRLIVGLVGVILFTGLAIAGTLYFLNLGSGGKDPEGEPEPDPATVQRQLEDAAPERDVRIDFKVTPPSATMLVHGKVALGHFLILQESSEPFRVRFTADGYELMSVDVVPDKHRTYPVTMTKLKK